MAGQHSSQLTLVWLLIEGTIEQEIAPSWGRRGSTRAQGLTFERMRQRIF